MSPFYRRRRLERLVRASVQLEELEERFLLAADLGQDSMPFQWRPSLKIESVSIATNSPLSNSPTWMAETVGSADGSADQHDHTWAPHHNHTHDHGGNPNHSPACQCEQCLGVDLKQDHNHTHDHFHDHIHHHHHHDHGVDPNHSPGCQCEQCLGVDSQQTNSQHHGHHHDHASPSAEGYDRLGNWIFVEAREPDPDNSDLFDSPVSAAPTEAPLADTFKLHSLPDASHTIYLDFDGHTTTGTTWNAASGQSSIVSPAYDPSNDGSNFNDNELARIQRIWQRVAEDFSPFQVNVTTEDPGAAALSRSNNSDTDWGTRVVITEDWDNCSCGGFAYLNSFMDSTDEPVFVFNTGEIGVSAAATHEVGHALGLSHDGLTTGAAYYGGHASGNAETGWGPIMGSGYSQNMTTWDAGDYYNSNNSENDWEIITTQNGFGYRTDDHGNNSGSATTLDNYGTNANDTSLIDVGGFGVIELDTDTDWFTFEAAGGQINLTINPYVTETYVNTGVGYTRYVEPTAVPPTAEQFSNLDVLATIYDSNLNVVATSNPTDSLIASFEDLAVTPGTYYLSIDGIGVGDWTASNPVGYDQSISRGMFAISGRVPFSDSGLVALADSAITEVDQAVSINVLANDYDPDGGSFGITSLGNPANGNIIESSGIITYTPNPGFTGTDSFPYTITDDQGEQDSTMVTITVNPPLPPILYVDDDQGETFERFYEDALSANDLEYNIWTVSTAGEPVATDLADYSAVIWNTGVDYTAANAGFTTGEQSTVATYLDGGGRMFIVGQDILYKPVEPDFRTDYLKVAQFTNDVQGLSTFVGVAGNEIGDGLSLPVQLPSDFGSDWGDTLAPTADAEGVFYRNTVNSNSQPYNTVAYSGDDFRVVFMAAGFEGISTSAANPNNQNAVLGRIMDYLMSDPNQSPVATDNNYSVDEDSVLNSGNVLTDGVADSDPDGDPLSVSTTPVSGASNGSVTLQTNGSFTYTPAANFNGEDSFVYQISDGKGGSDTATVTITVNSINDAPTANDDSATTNQDVPVTGSPLANDSDIDGDTLIIDSFTQAANGTVTNNGGGTLLYTPDNGYVGSDSFTYTISDGNGGTDTATVSLSVLKVNQPPIASDDSATTDEDTAVNISPLANDTDSNGDTLTIVSFTQASNGTVSDNGGGSLTYTPNSNYNGDDSFTYSVSDGDGGSDTATVTITVNSINDAPTANDDSATTDQDVSVTVSPLTNDSDIDGDTLSIDSFTQATNGTVTNNGNGTLLYTPDSGYVGSDSFTYTVSDGNGGTDTASVSVTVASLVGLGPKIATSILTNVGTADWITVPLSQNYNSPIIVATPVHVPGRAPVVTRIGNISSNSFDIRVQRVDGVTDELTGIQVQYVVADEGVYTEAEHGIKMEAVRFSSTITDHKGNWKGESSFYSNSYTSPVVLGQVMSYNQSEFSVFWTSGSSRTSPPSATDFKVGKHVGEDPNTTRIDETLGYLVIEAGSGTVGGLEYSAAIGTDIVRGTQHPVTQYSISGLSTISSIILSQVGMDGGDGGWAVLSGTNPINGTTIDLAIEEDLLRDTERWHTTEQVAYLAFNASNANPTANDDSVTTLEDTSVAISVLDNDSDANSDPLSINSFTQGTSGTVTDNGDGSLTYTPNGNYNGSDAFNYTVSDGNGGTDTATVNVTITPVNDDPTADDDTATVNEDGTVSITVLTNDNDIDGDSVSIDSFEQGSNGTVTDNGDGTLTYTPTNNYNGSDAFNYNISDGNGGTDTATVNITITPVNDAPTANDDTATANEDGTVIITVLANDDDIDGDTVSIDSFEQGSDGTVTNNGDGTLTYAPNSNYSGSDAFNYTVSDGNGGTDTATVNLTITPENDPPVAANDSASTDQDTPVVVSPLTNDSDVDGDTLSISSFTQATNGTVTDNGGGTLTYTPNSGYVGTDSFTYTVSDGNGETDTATVNLTVLEVNQPPVANDDSATTNEDTAVNILSLANDTDSNGDTLSIASFTQGSNGTVTNNGDGTLTYAPNANFSGSDSFSYTISDGRGGSDAATVNVTISPVNDDPAANDDTATVNEDDTVIITVLNNDNDIDGDSVSIDSFGQGSNGTVTDNGDGSLTYTPNGNYNGSDAFNYTVSDGNGGTDTATVNITITPENDPPVAADDSASTDQDTPVVVSPLVNDSDVDDNTLSISSFTQATNGTVTDNGGDTLLYTPNSGYVGTDSFTYTVSDNNGATDTATVSVTVDPVVASGPKLESGIVSNVGTNDWTTVTLTTSYTSMVVVATLVLPDGTAPLVTRIDNVAANSFDLRVQRADGLTGTISGIDVHYIAVEEGIYTQADDGITMEAVKFTSTVTDGRTSWVGGESRTYNNSYSSPVVLGQVMSFNDSNFSVFWALGRIRGSAPDSSNFNVGKHVGEDQNFARANETIGYVVIESGTGTINGFEYSAAVGSDTVRGTDNGSYTYDINGLSSPNSVALSSAGMDGRDGSWPVLLAPTPLSGATINLAVDEDQLRDGERRHTTEQVAYFAVSTPASTVATSLDANLLSEPSLISDVARRVDRVLGILDAAASDTEVESGLARHWDLQLADIFSSISSLFDDDQQLTNSDASEAGFSEAAETALSEIRSWLLGDGPLPSNVDDIFADYI